MRDDSSPELGAPAPRRSGSGLAAWALRPAQAICWLWQGLRTWLFRDSLRRRIVLLATAGLLLAIAVFGALGIWAVEESIERTLQERLTLGRVIASHVDYVLRDSLEPLQAIARAEGPNLEADSPDRDRPNGVAAYPRTSFSSVYVLDRAGRVVWAEPEAAAEPGQDLTQLDYVRQGLSSGWSTVTSAHARRRGGGLAVSAIAPVRGRAGEIVGLVVGDLDLPDPRLQQLIRPAGLGQTARVDIVDREGVVIASTNEAYLLQRSDHRSELGALIEARRSTVGTCHSCHEAAPSPQREAEVMALAPLGTASWGVVVREAEREALAPAHRLEQRVLLVGGPLFLAALAVAGYIGRGIARSIGELTYAAERITAGDLTSPVPQSGQDEIGRLARTFDAMRLRLKASLEHVQRLNAELEARVRQRTEQLAESEAELRRRNEELCILNEEIGRKEADRGELLKKVITAQEEERKRIARDLHDDTSQTLAALLLAIETADETLGTPEAERQMGSARALATQVLDGIHKLILDLRPSLLDDLGLVVALRWYAESRLEAAGIKVDFQVDGPDRRLPPEVETTVFRIVQEAIMNIAKHARAERAVVSLEFGEASLGVEVEDDGQGFVVDSVGRLPTGASGLGLLGMRERVALVGGALDVHSRPGLGTTIRLQVPLPVALAADSSRGGESDGQDTCAAG